MGIFSDACINPDCQGRVAKAAKFCRTCGTAAPDADTNCGGCGSVVSSSSKFCWKCGADLSDQRKVPLFDNRWVRGNDDFAVRVEDCDVKGFLTKGLVVEHGTRGLLFQKGRFCGYIEPGKYDTNGLLKKVNHFNQTTPTAVVLMDVGDVEVHLEAIKLNSREHLEVDAIFKTVVQLKDPEAFYVNAFKGRNHLTIGYVGGSIADELRAALQTYVGAHSVEDLYNNTDLRAEVERQMQLQLEPILERIGLEVVQVRFVEFFCPAYDPIREQQSELFLDTKKADVDVDRLKLTQRLRRELTTEKMDKFKTEADFENFVRQTEHELGLKDVIRADEMDRLKRQFAHDRNVEILTRQIEIQGIRDEAERNRLFEELEAKIERFRKKRDAEREDRTLEADTDRTIRAGDHGQDMTEAMDALHLRKEVEDVEHLKDSREQQLELERLRGEQQVEAERLKARSQASVEALMSILDDAGADKLAEIEKLRIHQNLSPDQIIAMTAADSPQVAQALAEKYKAEASMSEERFQQMEAFMAQQQATATDSANRMERILNVSLQQMGLTASTRAQAPNSSQTVVTPVGGAGGGTPIIVNPQTPEAETVCSKCKTRIPADSQFCPDCGKKL
jgi:hypothetical protein